MHEGILTSFTRALLEPRATLLSFTFVLLASMSLCATRAGAQGKYANEETGEVSATPSAVKASTRAREVDDEKADAVSTDDKSAEAPESRDLQLFRAQNSWFGPVGGFHVVDAGSAAPGTLRLQLGVDFFRSHGFMLPGDTNQYSGGTLALSWTLTDYLELFGSVANHANYNDKEDPKLLQVLGDTTLGLKGFQAVLPWLTLGGDFRIVVLNTVGDIGPVLSALSFGFRGNVAIDGRQFEEPIPLLARFNLDYYFDNSAGLIDGVENSRYQALGADRRERALEDRNLIRRVERFALGINRTDALNIGLGVEVPLRVDGEFYLHPLLEWTLSVPVNRQGYNCLRVDTNAGPAQPDGCLKVAGMSAMPSTLSFGVRAFPPVRGLAFGLGLDIGVSGTSTFVRELAANKPYDVLFALSYAIDTRPPKPIVKEVTVERQMPQAAPPKARVQGAVVDASSGAPVAGAAIRYPGGALTAQLSDEQGRFVSYELDPGEARFDISHPDYEARTCAVMIPVPVTQAPGPTPATEASETTGGPPLGNKPAPPVLNPYTGPAAKNDAAPLQAPASAELISLRCELVAKPRTGSVRGVVMSEAGKPVADAHVDLTGPATQSLVTDAQGQFVVVSLAAGSYGARVESDAYLIKLAAFDVKPGETATPEITLVVKPKQSSVELTKQEVRIRKQIFFKTNSAEISSEKSNGILSEIADLLLRNPQVKAVEIQGHTDNKGAPEINQQLSQLRAEAVRTWLVNAGVEAARLTAKGYGDTRPLEPNLTERHRARNRRVQFMIKKEE